MVLPGLGGGNDSTGIAKSFFAGAFKGGRRNRRASTSFCGNGVPLTDVMLVVTDLSGEPSLKRKVNPSAGSFCGRADVTLAELHMSNKARTETTTIDRKTDRRANALNRCQLDNDFI